MNPPMPENRCPECGAPLTPGAALGLCARCLLAGAAEPTEHGAPRSAPPLLAEVASAFPQLEVVQMIGHGGMGAVFQVRQPKLNRSAALKLLPQSLAADPAFAGRFEREAQLLARLSHPNITAVYDYGQAGGFFFLLMEFVDGVNLRQAMRASRFTPAQALGVVPKICEALQYAHDEGVLHRDIKPENILLDAKGRVKLADFGIAKLVAEPDAATADSSAKAPSLTHAGAALGTPSYMAPEQRDTPGDVDHRADIYSLGVVFYELLTGELPVGKFAPPSALSAADPRVDAIVQQALQKERARRQHSAGEMKTQVETLADAPGLGEIARPPRLADGEAPWRAYGSALLRVLPLAASWGFCVVFLVPKLRNLQTQKALFPSDGFRTLEGTVLRMFDPGAPMLLLLFCAVIALAEWLLPGWRRHRRLALRFVTAAGNGIALVSLLGLVVMALILAGAKSVAGTAQAPPARTSPSDSASAEERAAHAELETSYQEYEQLLTELRAATFDLDLADLAEGTAAEREQRRADIKARCDGLATQTARLREKILALGQRAAGPRERQLFPPAKTNPTDQQP